MEYFNDISSIPLACDSSELDSSNSDIPITPMKNYNFYNNNNESFEKEHITKQQIQLNCCDKVNEKLGFSEADERDRCKMRVVDECLRLQKEENNGDSYELERAELLEGYDTPRKLLKLEDESSCSVIADDTKMQNAEAQHRIKCVLVEKDTVSTKHLPNGWIKLTHSSGMPVYLHRASRVCTFAQPYYLGPDSVRHHNPPLSAVPCLQYRRALQAENMQQSTMCDKGTNLPAKLESLQEQFAARQLTPLQLREYCQSLFQFKLIHYLHFSSWLERRQYAKQARREQLRKDSMVITCPMAAAQGSSQWLLNPAGKSFVCILHDYAQMVLKQAVQYSFVQIEKESTPFVASVLINGVQYGEGWGSTKRQAKQEAARATLAILQPAVAKMLSVVSNNEDDVLSFFDSIMIEDPRVQNFCQEVAQPEPHSILLACLQRNFAHTEDKITYQMKTGHEKSFTITFGAYSASVDCCNKRQGKQRASQALLQIIHPHVQSWGSLLRMYGNSAKQLYKEKKLTEQEHSSQQGRSKAGNNWRPNVLILNQLKQEMLKLRAKQEKMRQTLGRALDPLRSNLVMSSSASDLMLSTPNLSYL